MPIVRIEMLAGRSPETKQQIAAEMTKTIADLCQVDPAHIYVMFQDVMHADWAVAGKVFPSPKVSEVVAQPLAPQVGS
jgi:4-oxalocrotonate tautomerase